MSRAESLRRAARQVVGWAGRRPITIAIAVATLVGGFLYLASLFPAAPSSSITLEGSGNPRATVLVKVNSVSIGRVEFTKEVESRIVRFDGQPIKLLELVPEGDPGTRFRLARTKIAFGSQAVVDRRGEQLSVLQFSSLRGLEVGPRGVEGRLTDRPASIADTPLPPLVVPNKLGALQRWLAGTSRSPSVPNIWVVALLFGLAAVILPSTRKPLWAGSAVVAVWVLAFLLYKVVPDLVNPAPPVAVAVGAASYFGNVYRGQQLAAILITLAILGAAVAARVFLKRRPVIALTGYVQQEHPVSPRTRTGPSWRPNRGVLIATAAWSLLGLTIVPTLSSPVPQPLGPGWDLGNGTAWNFLDQNGFVPMKDFWFPYGFQWLLFQVPLGAAWAWLVNITQVGLFGWAIWRLSGRDVGRTIACLIAVTLLAGLGSGLWRYLPALIIAATYAALGPAQWRRPQFGHLMLGAACAVALFVSPDVLLLGIAGAAFVLFGDLLFGRLEPKPLDVSKGLAIDVLPVIAAVALCVVIWSASGALSGNVDFFAHPDDVSAYVASDQVADGMLSKLSLIPRANSLVATLPFLLLAAGLILGFVGNQPRNTSASRLLLAASGCSLVFLARGLVRPNDLLHYLPLVSLTCATILLWNVRSVALVTLAGALAGATLAGLQSNGGLDRYLDGAANSPIRAVNSLIYASQGSAVEFAKRENHRLDRYEDLPDIELARELERISGSRHPSFAVLGDAQILYVWFNQLPPFHINLYDSSPIREQRKMIDRIESAGTQYIVLKQEPAGIDGVPYQVRDPLLYSYVIENYVPSRPDWRDCRPLPSRCMAADILVRRKLNQRPQIEFWQSRLGATLDFGFIPSYAKTPQPCSGTDCTSYALVQGRAAKKGDVVTLEATNGRSKFDVLLKARPDTFSYTLRLDRLWFWPLLGPQAELTSRTPGWMVEIKQGKDDDRLY
jgi:hypothetical protein